MMCAERDRDSFDSARMRRARDTQFRAGVRENVAQLLFAKLRVDRHTDMARDGIRDERDDRLERGLGPDRDAIADSRTSGLELVHMSCALERQFAIAERTMTDPHREAVIVRVESRDERVHQDALPPLSAGCNYERTHHNCTTKAGQRRRRQTTD